MTQDWQVWRKHFISSGYLSTSPGSGTGSYAPALRAVTGATGENVMQYQPLPEDLSSALQGDAHITITNANAFVSHGEFGFVETVARPLKSSVPRKRLAHRHRQFGRSV